MPSKSFAEPASSPKAKTSQSTQSINLHTHHYVLVFIERESIGVDRLQFIKVPNINHQCRKKVNLQPHILIHTSKVKTPKSIESKTLIPKLHPIKTGEYSSKQTSNPLSKVKAIIKQLKAKSSEIFSMIF